MSLPEEPPERDVLSSLPRTRPQRRSAKRDAARSGTPEKPRRATPPKAKPAATRARPAASGAPKAQATPPPPPKAQTSAAPPPKAQATSPPPRSVDPPSRTDVLAGAVQAAGELAQAGFAVGGELLRVALSRLPRP